MNREIKPLVSIATNREEIEESMRELLEKQPESPAQLSGFPEIVMNNPRNYIQVPQFQGLVIATEETHMGKNMYDTLELLAQENTNMPSVDRFMTHWLNVRDAAIGRTQLFYADGSPVMTFVASELWNYMSSTDRSAFSKPCWTWLNALFGKEKRKWYVTTDLQVTQDSIGIRVLQGNKTAPKALIRTDCYVSLDFNEQGMPTTELADQAYQQGTNLRYWHPRNNSGAGFLADSGRDDLICDWFPTYSFASLGVRLASG